MAVWIIRGVFKPTRMTTFSHLNLKIERIPGYDTSLRSGRSMVFCRDSEDRQHRETDH